MRCKGRIARQPIIVNCLSESEWCYENNTTCPCYKADYHTQFIRKDGSIFTTNKALEMLENTASFNEDQDLLIMMCEYAIKHCERLKHKDGDTK